MRPYYEDSAAGITIYHGDCREILPTLDADTVDLVLTDPPYGISYSPGGGGRGWFPGGKIWTGDNLVRGDDQPFDPAPLLTFRRLILWGGNHYANRLPPSPTWIVWYKRWFNDQLVGMDFADCEMAWTNLGGPARVYKHRWNGLLRDSEKGEHYHPTQKPVALMRWCIQRFPQGSGPILDPFMGSGPVLRAAKDLGRRAIGIEIEERYCEVAARRLAQAVLPLEVPAAPAPAGRQSALGL